MKEEPRAYGFTCENGDCLAIMVVYPHPDSPGLCDPFVRSAPVEESIWEDSSPSCPNCSDRMDLMTGDPVSDIIVGAKGLYR